MVGREGVDTPGLRLSPHAVCGGARIDAFEGVVAGVAAYVVAMMLVAVLMPTVDELGSFPASTLWLFRLSSLFTLATMWAVIGLGLAWSLGKVQRDAQDAAERRQLAHSL